MLPGEVAPCPKGWGGYAGVGTTCQEPPQEYRVSALCRAGRGHGHPGPASDAWESLLCLCWGEGCGSGGPEKVVFLSSMVGIWGFLCP